MNKEKAQIIKETKRMLIGKATTMQNMEMYTPCSPFSVLHGRPDTKTTHKHIVWNDSHFVHLFQASNHIVFLFLILTAALEVLVY